MPSDSRSVKRRERYNELRALGFSPTDARRLRDMSGKNIQFEISTEQRRISRKSVDRRTADESFRLTRIQQRNRSANIIQRESRMDSRRERWKKFSDWSESGIWPKRIKNRIRQINTRVGLGPDDGYGYRRFYYEYVERLSLEESLDLSERNDSGMRYLIGKSLVRNRVNLRNLFNPPKQDRKVS